jgi:hypothetical protein
MHARARRLAAGFLLVVATAACGAAAPAPTTAPVPAFAIRVAAAEPEGCAQALLVGSLERTALSGLGVGTADGITAVEWPFGYRAAFDATQVVLLDGSGRIVAREHDRVHVSGGLGNGPTWFACGGVTVESNEGG